MVDYLKILKVFLLDGDGVNFITSQVEDHMLPEPENIPFLMDLIA